jgi:hypothetical protein
MTELLKMQRALTDYIHSNNDEILPYLSGGQDALGLYQNSYYALLCGQIEQEFPQLHIMMGDEAFKEMAVRYIHECPSTDVSYRAQCNQVPEFLSTNKYRPLFIEAAQFDALKGTAMLASDQEILLLSDVESLDEESWPDFRLQARACVCVYSCTEFMPQGDYVCWRDGAEFRSKKMDKNEKALCDCFLIGHTFKALCDTMQAAYREDGGTLVEWISTQLQAWIEQGLLLKEGHADG